MNILRPKIRLIMAIAACILVTPVAAEASNLTYTATGGIITGTLNGTPFTNATWSITGTADPTNVVAGTAFSGLVPYNFLAMTPFLTIQSGSSTLQATLVTSGSIGEQVGAFSANLNAFQSGLTGDVFSYLNGDGSFSSLGMGAGGTGLYITLQSPFSGSGIQNAGSGTYSTDIGPMVISAHTGQAATFTVSGASPSPVPEIDPATFGSAFALLIGSLGLVERRARRAIGLINSAA